MVLLCVCVKGVTNELRLRLGRALRHAPQRGDNFIVEIDSGLYHMSYMVTGAEIRKSLPKASRKHLLLRYNLR